MSATTAEPVAPPAEAEPPLPRSPWAPGSPRLYMLGILVLQAVLSLRLQNTPQRDEALYLWSGYVQIQSWLHGGVDYSGDFLQYFSGSPYIYPVYGATLDKFAGLEGARLLSLVFMLSATALVGGAAKKIFNEQYAGVWAAAAFMACQSTLYLGHFATFDPMAIFLLSLSFWLAVRDYGWICAGPVAAVAIASKFAAGIFVPVIAAMAFLVVWPRIKVAFIRGLTVGIIGLGGGVAYIQLTGSMAALTSTTTDRKAEGATSAYLLEKIQAWIGPTLLVGVIAALVVLGVGIKSGRFKGLQMLIPVVLFAAGLLAPAYQLKLQTETSLSKHVGYGAIFVAPLIGLLIVMLMKKTKIGGLAIGLVVIGAMTFQAANESYKLYHFWPDAGPLVSSVRPHVKEGGSYFTEISEVIPYYTKDLTAPTNWKTLDWYEYKGKQLPDSYGLAIKDGVFDVLVTHRWGYPMNGLNSMEVGAAQLKAKKSLYTCVVDISVSNIFGDNGYQVWVKKGSTSAAQHPGGCKR